MFTDIKVLELASVLAGPSVGQFFAELGAEVIKVENSLTGGDVTRSWKSKTENTDDRSAYFCSVNWGKRSVALDLSAEQGRTYLKELAKRSDVVIASYKPGDAKKLGVDYESLAAINPKIIYGQITGYGSDDERVGYDAVLQAETGFMSMNGEPGGSSLKMPVALVDVLAGHQLKEALLLAIIDRMKTDRGSLIEVSLLQSAVSSLVNQATNWLVAGVVPAKEGSSHPNIAPYGDTFVTLDGQEILLAVGNDKQFMELCQVLQLPEIASNKRYSSNHSRVVNRAELKHDLSLKIRHLTSNQLMSSFRTAKIPAGIIQDIKMVFENPRAQELVLSDGTVQGLRTFVGTPFPKRTGLLPPPHFGQHTDEILSALTKY